MRRHLQLIIGLLLIVALSTARAQPSGQVVITILDATTNRLTPARVRLTRHGRPVANVPAVAVAVMYGLWDHEDGYAFQPDSSFYVAGSFRLSLPPGTYQLSLSKGHEFLRQQVNLTVKSGQTLRQTYRLKRWVNMAAKGWFSTDGHIHIRRSPRENPLILTWLQAEDVNVGALLRMGDFWETYYPQYAYGEAGVYGKGNYLLTTGQEDPRTPELGHAFALGAANRVRQRDRYYFFDEVFDKVHQLGGLTGYAHQAETFHGYRGLILDGLRGKVDALELLQFCVDERPLHTEHYYHLLDLGIPLTATAGSDFPWCGQDHGHGPPERLSRIGNARFYTYLSGPLTFTNWRRAVQAGHTFVSSGPMLDLHVNGAFPGDKLTINRGDSLRITVRAYGHANQIPLDTLELISHGRVIGRAKVCEGVVRHSGGLAGSPERFRQSASQLSLSITLPSVERGQWIAARCTAGPGLAAHTTPVYVTVDGGGFHNPQTVGRYLDLSEQYLQEIEYEISHLNSGVEPQAWRYADGLRTRIAEVRRIIEKMRKDL